MIKIIVSGFKFNYKGNIEISIDDSFVHIIAEGFTDDINPKYSWDYKVDDRFLTKDVESITGYSYDKR